MVHRVLVRAVVLPIVVGVSAPGFSLCARWARID